MHAHSIRPPHSSPIARTSASATLASLVMAQSTQQAPVRSALLAPTALEATPISLWLVHQTLSRHPVLIRCSSATAPPATLAPTAPTARCVHPTTTVPTASCPNVQPTAFLLKNLSGSRTASATRASLLRMASLQQGTALCVPSTATVQPLA